MSMFNNKKDAASPSVNVNTANINTLVGEGCTIKGDVTAKSSIKIEGQIQGNLSVEGSVIIGDKGVVHGDVRCSDLVVLGRLEGNVHARQLQLKQTAHLQGNIEAQTLQVEPGAIYQGSVTMKNAQTTPSKPLTDKV